MKRIVVFIFLVFHFHDVIGQTNEETRKIIDDILSITNKYNKTWETLNMDMVASFHSDSSFRYYRNMKLAVGNNEDFKRLMPKYMTSIKSWKLEVSDPVVQVLGNDAAVIGFTGKAEMITNDNKITDAGSGAYTYVWKKTGGVWRLVHIHESAK